MTRGSPPQVREERRSREGGTTDLTAGMSSRRETVRVDLSSSSHPTRAARDEEEYRTLKRSVLDLGFIRWGSLVTRFMPCGKQGCCCQGNPPHLHGPYYQWTRKVKGKTATVRLTFEEAKLLEEWIANGRQFDRIISQMEKVSFRITNRLLRQVQKS